MPAVEGKQVFTQDAARGRHDPVPVLITSISQYPRFNFLSIFPFIYQSKPAIKIPRWQPTRWQSNDMSVSPQKCSLGKGSPERGSPRNRRRRTRSRSRRPVPSAESEDSFPENRMSVSHWLSKWWNGVIENTKGWKLTERHRITRSRVSHCRPRTTISSLVYPLCTSMPNDWSEKSQSWHAMSMISASHSLRPGKPTSWPVLSKSRMYASTARHQMEFLFVRTLSWSVSLIPKHIATRLAEWGWVRSSSSVSMNHTMRRFNVTLK